MEASIRSINKIYNVLIVGGGPVGISAALHLAKTGISDIAVVERDNSYTHCSAMLSAGGIRQQFSVPENIKMSIYGASFIKNVSALSVDGISPDINFKENGYLFIAGEKSRHVIDENHTQQLACGADWIKKLNKNDLKSKFPWLHNFDIEIGTYGIQNEGFFDPWLFVQAMKQKAKSLGIEFISGSIDGAKITPITPGSFSYNISSMNVALSKKDDNKWNTSNVRLSAQHYVNAAGAWSGRLVDDIISSASHTSRFMRVPVRPKKRCIFNVQCPETLGHGGESLVPPLTSPLLVDPSGVYFRPEGNIKGRFLAGVSPPADNDPDCSTSSFLDLEVVDHDLFESIIWPKLCHRVPAFERLKVVSSWAGFYDYNTLDQNAIIGTHSEIRNLLLCTGFSGHGLQQSPAAGRAVAELVQNNLKGFSTLDLSRFSFERVVDNKPIFETGIV
mmetsp:Transcript_13267/g.19907  ORF Transcript_13267/g.19907 Transcript_13267/m.19907 type:complete len:446 (+) Transcript_13267:12-1349(+)